MLSLVVIRCADLQAAERFYGALGLSFERHSHGKGPEHLTYVCPRSALVFEVYPLAEGAAQTTAVRIGFSVDDVDLCLIQLQSLGIEILRVAVDSPWGRRAVVRDPQGHVVELLQAL